ncbi:PREDICTED: protein CHUP1, chloroplastic-like [Nicotiana attenuata]|uniref:Protein chup1, chloroplastic n=1 Tax=Nicotiana attenuata TaxID=49451 RepID=A0A1J6IW28_NICAT|nr:PREDICTED: protein CHUP1, chloroplastic-like [Nicotiana attenuata]OIT04792.1 protein chup1, chloroplastic [Nicotiana attenuata]
MVRDNRNIRPVLLKIGAVLVLSLGGVIYTIFRTKRIKPSNLFSPPCSTGGENGELTNDDHASHATPISPSSRKSVSTVSDKHEDLHICKHIIENSTALPSSSGMFNSNRDGFLLPEFNELVKELRLSTSKRDIETLLQYEDSPREYRIVEMVNHEQEIKSLKNIVKTLEERERTLEIQLLEYYGLKEQETAIMELQNQLKINNMEAKLFGLKIESLTADKMRLEAQVADYAKVVSELDAAKVKIKQLKKKLRSEADHSKEQILTLQEKVMKLHDEEKKAVEAESDVQLKLRKLKDLENQADELKKSNHSLRKENSELAHRLESVQIIAASVLEDEETEALKEETLGLKKQNEDLAKEVERLKADRCNDAEELVYLRWINACLRYELRNLQPVAGKTIARDLSKTLSPKSEEKAKQLILEYANKESQGEREISVTDFDSDWSSSRTSFFTDSGEFDDTSTDNSSPRKTSGKKKVFSKLMRLVRGKDRRLSRSSSMDMVHNVEDNVSRHSSFSPGYSSGSSKQFLELHSASQSSRSDKGENNYNYSIDSTRNSDGGSSSGSGRLDYISNRLTDSPQENITKDDSEKVQKTDLVKYAEVLKGSRSKAGFCRRSASVSSF